MHKTTHEDSLLCLAHASVHQQRSNHADSVMWCDFNVHAFTLCAIGVLKTCLRYTDVCMIQAGVTNALVLSPYYRSVTAHHNHMPLLLHCMKCHCAAVYSHHITADNATTTTVTLATATVTTATTLVHEH
jgi:hypothetical protein